MNPARPLRRVARRPVYPPAPLRFWRGLVNEALANATPTPFYLFSADPIRAALAELGPIETALPVPIRHWLSCKTQPVRPLLRWWQQQGRPIEVVSEFELRAALAAGFAAENVLVNGPAKDRWLPQHPRRRLRVNFDSLREMRELLPQAKDLDWSVGVRLLTAAESDPEHPGQPTQFGMVRAEAVAALQQLQRSGVRLETVHFHLRTNVRSADVYADAIRDAALICRAAEFSPTYLDCGGGLPPPQVQAREGGPVAAAFSLREWGRVLQRTVALFPSLRELWLENGRFLSARSGVLVVRVLEVKHRRGRRQLICDGGRTLHALVSNWEDHTLVPASPGSARRIQTAVYGPTCMAFDRLALCSLPATVGPGDVLIWLDAGAYHIPWETQFSHGHAAVLWHQDGQLTVARRPGTFRDWWSRWLVRPPQLTRATFGSRRPR